MIVTTGNNIEDCRVTTYLGVVRGVVVRAPTIGQGLVGGFQSMGGGNVEAFATMADQAREEAYQRMIMQAQEMGAEAVIAFRYDATEFEERFTEVLAYGTAVLLDVTGIGVTLGTKEQAIGISAVTAGGGAAQAGLQVGDQLIAIDQDPVEELGVAGVTQRLRGKIGTTISIAVRRANGHVERLEVSRRRTSSPTGGGWPAGF